MELEGKPGEWVRVQTLEADERKKQPSAAATREGTVIVNNTSELNRVSAPAARDPAQRKAKVFIGYSTTDMRDCDRLKTVLKIMRSEGLAETWEQRCLIPSQDWDKTIKRELEEADLILLLWSQEFQASDYSRDVEMKRALERAAEGKAKLVSIILKPCEWGRHEAAKFLVLPFKGKPVWKHNPRTNAWYNVQEGLRKVLEELRAKSKA